jgi:outer membrane beta-barrel protein
MATRATNRSPAAASPETETPQAGPAPSYGGPQKKVSIDQLKKQYWNQGGELDVVQNRIYTKANKWELGLFGGFVSTDPFLNVKSLGGSVGYYLSETFSIRALGWKDFSSNSQALQILEHDTQRTANTNIPSWFAGGEAGLDIIYGKLALFGRHIMYYDLHAYLGLGETGTEVGTLFTQMGGLGQQIFFSQTLSLRLDWRLMHYREAPKVKAPPVAGTDDPPLGSSLETRSNFTNVVMLGVGFLF